MKATQGVAYVPPHWNLKKNLITVHKVRHMPHLLKLEKKSDEGSTMYGTCLIFILIFKLRHLGGVTGEKRRNYVR